MKAIILLIIFAPLLLAQDNNESGFIDYNSYNGPYDYNGDGVINSSDIPGVITSKWKAAQTSANNPQNMSFSQYWTSPAGAFTNCWDGYAGYIDGDTLLDVVGFTFSPAKLYIWEQSPAKPDSFYLVQEFVKAEGGSFGPIFIADTDQDGLPEIIAADVLGIARIYIYECTGNNTYVDQNTQTTLVHPSNSEGAQGLYVGDMNHNGKKEILLLRGASSGGEVRIWEHSGAVGQPVYTNIYTYTTVSYIFGKGGFGDSDNDGWDEIFLTYGGLPTFNTNIRRIEYDSASATFQHQIFAAPSIGMPAMYRVYDLGSDNIKELIMTCNSNNTAAAYVFRANGPNSYEKIDSVFETSDNNNMLSSDIKVLSGNSQPTLLMGSFNGRVYTYQYDGSKFVKDYENLSYPGSAIRRVYWLPWIARDGYFNTWSSTNSDGTFYIYSRNSTVGTEPVGSTVTDFRLEQNYPNPFNPSTKIIFEIPPFTKGGSGGLSTLKIYNSLGEEITTLVNLSLSPGEYSVTWNASAFPSGVYFYTLTTGDYSLTKKMVLFK